jgi:hypothetical protein
LRPGTLDTTPDAHPRPVRRLARILGQISLEDNEEISLVNEFGVDGAYADEVLGYEGDGDDDDDNRDSGEGPLASDEQDEAANSDEDEDEADDDDDDHGADKRESFGAFQKRVRVNAAKRAEGNRRAGGLKTQRAMVRAWEVCLLLLLPSSES